jgi:hypothetical protein
LSGSTGQFEEALALLERAAGTFLLEPTHLRRLALALAIPERRAEFVASACAMLGSYIQTPPNPPTQARRGLRLVGGR